MHVCLLRFSVQTRITLRAILFTSNSCFLTIFFRCVDVRGLRIYETVLSLLVLLIICAHIRALNGFHVLLHNLIHQLFLFSMLEAFPASVLYSQRTQLMFKCFFGFGVFLSQNRTIDNRREGDNEGYFILGDKDRQ